MISVVCVYDDENILNNWLLKSLKNQTTKFELIKIDNTQNRFKSAAEALNYGGEKKAKGKYIMFVHQDVDLCSISWLENTEKILDSIFDLGIAGVVGVNKEGKQNVIKCGIPPVWLDHIPIQKPKRVQTLDECLVIIPKATFDMFAFDETVCNDWHLYAVDYCLTLRERNRGIYVIPAVIYHRSKGYRINNYFQAIFSLGSLPIGYYQTLYKVLKKHKKYFKRIYTTSGRWNTSSPLILQRIIILIKEALRYFLIKIGVRYLWKKYLKGKIFKGQRWI